MALPAWIRPVGLVEHFIVGGVLAALLAWLGTPAAARVMAVAAVGSRTSWATATSPRPRARPGAASSMCWRFCPYPWCGGLCDATGWTCPVRQVHPESLMNQPLLGARGDLV